MLPLIPLAISIAPQIASWLFGPGAEKTTAAVAQAAATITGTTDPDAQARALEDPAKATAFQVELAKIVAAAEADQRASDLATLQAQLADVAGARAQMVALAQSHSLAVWGTPVVSMIVLGTFAIMLSLILTHQLPPGSEALANVMLGGLATMAGQVITYWVGSNSQSKTKDATIAEQSRSLAASTPGGGQ